MTGSKPYRLLAWAAPAAAEHARTPSVTIDAFAEAVRSVSRHAPGVARLDRTAGQLAIYVTGPAVLALVTEITELARGAGVVLYDAQRDTLLSGSADVPIRTPQEAVREHLERFPRTGDAEDDRELSLRSLASRIGGVREEQILSVPPRVDPGWPVDLDDLILPPRAPLDGSQRYVRSLLRKVRSRTESERVHACYLLGGCDSTTEILAALREAVADPSLLVRANAALSLGLLRDADSFQLVLDVAKELLGSGDINNAFSLASASVLPLVGATVLAQSGSPDQRHRLAQTLGSVAAERGTRLRKMIDALALELHRPA